MMGGIVQKWRHAASRRHFTGGSGAWLASCGWVVECWQHSGWVYKQQQPPQAGRCAILRNPAKKNAVGSFSNKPLSPKNLSAVMAARPIAQRAPRELLVDVEEGHSAIFPTLSIRTGARVARDGGPDGARGPDQGWVPNWDPSCIRRAAPSLREPQCWQAFARPRGAARSCAVGLWRSSSGSWAPDRSAMGAGCGCSPALWARARFSPLTAPGFCRAHSRTAA